MRCSMVPPAIAAQIFPGPTRATAPRLLRERWNAPGRGGLLVLEGADCAAMNQLSTAADNIVPPALALPLNGPTSITGFLQLFCNGTRGPMRVLCRARETKK